MALTEDMVNQLEAIYPQSYGAADYVRDVVKSTRESMVPGFRAKPQELPLLNALASIEAAAELKKIFDTHMDPITRAIVEEIESDSTPVAAAVARSISTKVTMDTLGIKSPNLDLGNYLISGTRDSNFNEVFEKFAIVLKTNLMMRRTRTAFPAEAVTGAAGAAAAAAAADTTEQADDVESAQDDKDADAVLKTRQDVLKTLCPEVNILHQAVMLAATYSTGLLGMGGSLLRTNLSGNFMNSKFILKVFDNWANSIRGAGMSSAVTDRLAVQMQQMAEHSQRQAEAMQALQSAVADQSVKLDRSLGADTSFGTVGGGTAGALNTSGTSAFTVGTRFGGHSVLGGDPTDRQVFLAYGTLQKQIDATRLNCAQNIATQITANPQLKAALAKLLISVLTATDEDAEDKTIETWLAGNASAPAALKEALAPYSTLKPNNIGDTEKYYKAIALLLQEGGGGFPKSSQLSGMFTKLRPSKRAAASSVRRTRGQRAVGGTTSTAPLAAAAAGEENLGAQGGAGGKGAAADAAGKPANGGGAPAETPVFGGGQ